MHRIVIQLFILSLFCSFYFSPELEAQKKTYRTSLNLNDVHQLSEKLTDRNVDSSIRLLDLAYSLILSEKDTLLKNKHLAYNRVMRAYHKDNDVSSVNEVEKLARLSLDYFKRSSDFYGMSKAYQVLGNLRMTERKVDKALFYRTKALTSALKTSNDSLITRMYFDKGMLLIKMGNPEAALEYAFSSLKHAEAAKDSLSLFYANYLMGGVAYLFKNYDQAEYYFTHAIAVGMNKIDPRFYSSILKPYAEVLLQVGKEREAIKTFEEALDYAVSNQKICEALHIYAHMGDFLIGSQEWEKAENYFQESRQFASENGVSTSQYFLYLAKVYALMNERHKALENLQKFLNRIKEAHLPVSNVEIYKDVAFVYEKIGASDKAFNYYKKYTSMADSIYSVNNQVLLDEMERRYLLEKNKNEEIIKQKAALAKSKNRQLWLSIVLLLVLAGGGSIIYFLNLRSHKEKEKFKLQIKENQLHQILLAQEEERKRIARELHDGVGQSLAALKMKLQMTDCDHSSMQTIQSVEALYKEVRSLSHQMMPQVLQENGLQEALGWLVDQNFSNSKIKADLVIHRLKRRLDMSIEIHIYRIVQELFNNILKHSNASSVGIQLFQREDKVFLIIEDNGRGFYTGQKYQGIGLVNVASRLESLSGKMEIQSRLGEGTFIRIIIPLSDQNKMSA